MWPWLVQSSVRRTCDSSRVSRVIRTGFHVTCTHKPVFYIHSYCVAAQQLRASCPHQLCCPVPLSFIGTCCSFCSFIISSNKLPQFPHSGSQLDSDSDRIKTYLLTKHWAEFSQSYLETYPNRWLKHRSVTWDPRRVWKICHSTEDLSESLETSNQGAWFHQVEQTFMESNKICRLESR